MVRSFSSSIPVRDFALGVCKAHLAFPCRPSAPAPQYDIPLVLLLFAITSSLVLYHTCCKLSSPLAAFSTVHKGVSRCAPMNGFHCLLSMLLPFSTNGRYKRMPVLSVVFPGVGEREGACRKASISEEDGHLTAMVVGQAEVGARQGAVGCVHLGPRGGAAVVFPDARTLRQDGDSALAVVGHIGVGVGSWPFSQKRGRSDRIAGRPCDRCRANGSSCPAEIGGVGLLEGVFPAQGRKDQAYREHSGAPIQITFFIGHLPECECRVLGTL